MKIFSPRIEIPKDFILNKKVLWCFGLVCFLFNSTLSAVNYVWPGPPGAGQTQANNGVPLTLLAATGDTFTDSGGANFQNTASNLPTITMDGSTSVINVGTIVGSSSGVNNNAAIITTMVATGIAATIVNGAGGNINESAAGVPAISTVDILNAHANGTYAPFNITNSGTIQGIALSENASIQETITNNATGIINNNGVAAAPAILVGNFGFSTSKNILITNNGTISATGGGAPNAIEAVGAGVTTITINNNNTIQTANILNDAIFNNSNFTMIVNAGNNSQINGNFANNNAVNADQFNVNAGVGGAVTLNGNIRNINTINVNSGTLNINNFSITNFATFTIAAGATTNFPGLNITGAAGSTLTTNGTLNVTGGTLNSDNTAVGSGGVVNLSGGTFTTVNMTDSGTFNQTGGTLTATTFTVTNGGRLTTGPVGTSTFTNLNINAGGTYTQNNNITVNNLLTNAGTYTQSGNVLVGSVSNTGTHFVPTTGVVTTRSIAGNYTTSGTFSPSIVSTTNFGQITATTANVSGNINVILPNGTTNLHAGDTFNVIVTPSGAALTYNPNTVITPFIFRLVPSALALGIVELIVGPFSSFNTNPLLACIASSIDQISLNPPNASLNTLVQTLFSVPNLAVLESDLEQLLPSVDQGLLINTVTLDQLLLDKVTDRLDLMRAGVDLVDRGYAAGDISGGYGSYGPLFYAGTIQQDDIGFQRGYTATTAGAAIVADTAVRCYGRLGIGISASNTVIKPGFGSVNFGNTISFYSVQPLIYGSLDYCGLFVDAFAGIAYNQYRTMRNIPFLNETATGKFYGVQTNGQARFGAIIAISTLQVTPIASVRYAHLRQQAYVETGAPIADLSISGTKETLVQGAYGLKLMDVSDPDFFPELHAYYISDIKRPNLQVIAQFAAGGPVCTDTGLFPARNGVDIGGSLSFLYEGMLLTFEGDVELRKKFTGYSGWIRVRWLFS